MLTWRKLEDMSTYDSLMSQSSTQAFAVFKHSTRCSVSTMAKKKLESDWNISDEHIQLYYLDLLAHRDISNKLASDLHIEHQSPQLLVVKDHRCIYNQSHGNIEVENINY